MPEGSIEVALLAALALVGGLVLETRVLLRWRSDAWFTTSFPLGMQLVPIPTSPEGEGRTRSVKWEVSRPGLVRWWADPDERRAPSGLRGVVWLAPTPRGVMLEVRWAPPFSPLLAAVWLAFLGAARGEARLTVPIAVAMAVGLGVVYWDRSRRVAAELRRSFLDQVGG